MGPCGVVITGMREGQYLVNAVAEKGKAMTYIRRKRSVQNVLAQGMYFLLLWQVYASGAEA